MNPTILSPTRMRQLAAMTGTRGVIPAAVSKACLLTNGTYYVDVVGDNPAIVDSLKRDGTLKFADKGGAFSLAALAGDVKTAIDNKRKNALAASAEAGVPATFPNIEHVQDDDAGTVYIVNWDLAPPDDGDNA